jgi:hypothetical protein
MGGNGTTFANGGLILDDGGTKRLDRDMFNADNAVWTGSGQFRISDPAEFTNLPGASFDARSNAILNWQTSGPGTFVNQGTFSKSAGVGETDVRVNFENTGTVEALSGTLLFREGDYVQSDGATRVDAALEVLNNDLELQGGWLVGGGTVTADAVVNGGFVSPGSGETGLLIIVGDYIQAVDGTLHIELAGTTPGEGYDVLNVQGNVSLDGFLTTPRIGGFHVELGQVFEIIQATGTVDDEFSMTDCSALFAVEYLPQEVTLEVIQTQPVGDVNCDGLVNVDDLFAVLQAWGPCDDFSDCSADLTGDGTVNIDDLFTILQNWGG